MLWFPGGDGDAVVDLWGWWRLCCGSLGLVGTVLWGWGVGTVLWLPRDGCGSLAVMETVPKTHL